MYSENTREIKQNSTKKGKEILGIELFDFNAMQSQISQTIKSGVYFFKTCFSRFVIQM